VVTIPRQFNGPDASGNGGYVAGMLAQELGIEGPATSTLRLPPPLDSPLTWERDGATLRLLTPGGAVVGETTDDAFSRPVPASPTVAEGEAGLAAYLGWVNHPFDRCFTCGTQRADGEGLRLFTGPTGDGRTAATWTPHPAFASADGAIDIPVTWAALDCPGGWAADFTEQTMVLGRMTAEVARRPVPGEPCLSVGHLDSNEGRKFFTSTALWTEEGELLGRAEQVWIQIDNRTSS
jgi:hypothetical protein